MTRVFVFFAVLGTAIASAAQGAASPVNFQPGSDLQKRALSPSPGPTNQARKAVIGQGKTMIDTGNPQSTSWNETIDLSGAGNVVNADMLWDSSSKIFYAFAHTTLRCSHGKTIEGEVLVGIYGKKNFLGKIPGSGWWVVDLQQGQCQAPLPGLYGCKFSSNGEPLACGRAEVAQRITDMAIVESTRF